MSGRLEMPEYEPEPLDLVEMALAIDANRFEGEASAKQMNVTARHVTDLMRIRSAINLILERLKQ